MFNVLMNEFVQVTLYDQFYMERRVQQTNSQHTLYQILSQVKVMRVTNELSYNLQMAGAGNL